MWPQGSVEECPKRLVQVTGVISPRGRPRVACGNRRSVSKGRGARGYRTGSWLRLCELNLLFVVRNLTTLQRTPGFHPKRAPWSQHFERIAGQNSPLVEDQSPLLTRSLSWCSWRPNPPLGADCCLRSCRTDFSISASHQTMTRLSVLFFIGLYREMRVFWYVLIGCQKFGGCWGLTVSKES